MRKHPHLFEANARIFLRRLSEKYNRPLTIGSIPLKEWEKIKSRGFDFVWLMGIWQRSPASQKICISDDGLRRSFKEALPDLHNVDIAGSPYSVYAYELDPALGKPEEILSLRKTLNQLGIGLILDFVPNHLAVDHPWTQDHPEIFLSTKPENAKHRPGWFFKTSKGVFLAHGRDPYFPPWTDTAQINFFSKEARKALVGELLKMTEICDGVRCDMAMLGLNDIFQRVWGEFLVGVERPKEEFWRDAIRVVKTKAHRFLFLAEVYWDLEWILHQQGFDFTYDKRLYDRLRSAPVEDIRGHLRAEMEYQIQCMRFIENHDEVRAPVAFGFKKSLAAAAVAMTIPGLRMVYDGQVNGCKIKLPIQLIREVREQPDETIKKFYETLLRISNQELFHDGEWRMLDVAPVFEGDASYKNVIGWSWTKGKETQVMVVNYSDVPSHARLLVKLPEGGFRESVTVFEAFSVKSYQLSAEELVYKGLPVALSPWETSSYSFVVAAS